MVGVGLTREQWQKALRQEFTSDLMYQKDMDEMYHNYLKHKEKQGMQREEKIEIIVGLTEDRQKMLYDKGDKYSDDKDTLSNFKRNAERLGLSKYQVLMVYMMKHVDAICNSIKQNPNAPMDKTEGLTGRISDAENYLDLLYCLLKEDGLV